MLNTIERLYAEVSYLWRGITRAYSAFLFSAVQTQQTKIQFPIYIKATNHSSHAKKYFPPIISTLVQSVFPLKYSFFHTTFLPITIEPPQLPLHQPFNTMSQNNLILSCVMNNSSYRSQKKRNKTKRNKGKLKNTWWRPEAYDYA